MEKKYYRRMCDFGAEFLSNGYKNPSPPRIVVDNVEVLEGAFTHSDFVVCYSGHFVNYEQFIQLPSLVPDVTMYNFYQPSPYKNLNDYVCRIRSREGAVLVPTNNGTRELIALKNSGCKRVVIGCLGDLPNKKNPTEINFFGKKYKAFSGTERIGKFLNAQFLYANITSNKRGEYHVRFVPMENYGKDLCHAAVENENTNMTQAFFSCLEENIRQQPELWLLWGVL